MNLDEATTQVRTYLTQAGASALGAGRVLKTIRAEKLYKEKGYPSFDKYLSK